jgi:FAD/FMN-containing dehydrogenase
MKPARALPDAFSRALAGAFPSDFLSMDPDDLLAYGRDWTREFEPAAAALAFPRTADEVARLVALCRAERVAMVPSGGRTGLAGGAVATNGELVVSLARMTRMDPVDLLSMTVRVQAGAVTQAVHEHVLQSGVIWPVDFASKGSSTIGGNIATNAGGVKVIRYGHTRQWVLGLQVVTAAGEVLELNGELEKNNTGVDLRQLFIGSEGTLGIVTEATLKLAPRPGKLDVLLFAVDSFAEVLQVFESVRTSAFTVMAYEFFTGACAARVERHRKVAPPFARPAPFYVLIELEDVSGDAGEDALLRWIESVLERPGVMDGTMAQSQGQARELWTLREGISESLSATGVPHKNDVALPLRELHGFYHDLQDVFADRYPGWEICLFGHVGDGNIHINVMKPESMDRQEFLRRTHEADRLIFEVVKAHRGSISAEHGIGLLKKDFLEYSRSPGELAMLRAIKRALDPDNLFNPGKIFDLDPART